MSLFFYNIFLLLFKAAMPVAALFNSKARKWVRGRKNILQRLQAAIGNPQDIIWMHCASLGEFEQGRPLIESLKHTYPSKKILLTFFSPSGYEVRKDYPLADWVFYLPMDGPNTARRFLEIVNPSLVIFVKYEFWFYYLKKIKYRNIPLLLVSALFWEKMSFFQWYGALQRKMASRFNHLFVQDEASKALMEKIGLGNITSISGDTRFDRVIDIAEKANAIPAIEEFLGGSKCIVAGSTWIEDETILGSLVNNNATINLKLIIAPHEINATHLADLRQRFPSAIFYSELGNSSNAQSSIKTSSLLIIDNIGLLSRLYRYAFISYIGGGHGKGIHNTLEAAVYGKPILFGPIYQKFREAKELLQNGGAICVNNAEELRTVIERLLHNDAEYKERSEAAGNYVYANRGATEKIIRYIQEKRLLTS